MRNQTESLLIRLPAELRNKIYVYALSVDCVFALPLHLGGMRGPLYGLELWIHLPARTWGVDRFINTFSFLMTCRQIHHEARILPYTINIIQVSLRSLPVFVKVIPEVPRKSIEVLRFAESRLHSWRVPSLEVELRALRELPLLKTIELDSPALIFMPFCADVEWVQEMVERYAGRRIKVVRRAMERISANKVE